MENKDKKAPARKPAAKKPAAKKAAPKKPAEKPASVDSCMEKYNALVAEIAKYETQRRAEKKHANFFTRHRRQIETMARNFEKFAGR